MKTPDTVLIVGAGPTGLTAALELTRFHIPVRIIDALPQASPTSRALAIHARTMELFAQRGLTDAILQIGNKANTATLYARGKILGKQDFSKIDSEFNYVFMLSQAETERLLTERLTQLGVPIERSVALIAIAQKGMGSEQDSVCAVLRHEDGRLEEMTAAYLISAEGAHSLVRRTLGVKFEGETLTQKFMVGDLYIESALPDDEMALFLGGSGFLAAFPLGNRRFRIIASELLNTPRNTEPTLKELQTAFDQDCHMPARLHDMVWSSRFVINSRMVQRLREGRIFFGGDSAHVHSPAGGQGMNTGIQDMINLCWKLAMVSSGKASASLVDTYGEERLAIIRSLLKTTETMTAGINTEHPMRQEIVTHVAPLAMDLAFVQNRVTRLLSQIGLDYRESSLSMNHRAPGSLHAGDRVPPCEVTSTVTEDKPTHLHQLVDIDKLTLFVADEEYSEPIPDLPGVLLRWPDVIQIQRIRPLLTESAQTTFRGLFGSSGFLVLVRPDSYVGFSGNDHSLPELTAWLEQWFAPASQPANIEKKQSV
jgi:2-polyprenyl-6-methoxyphenol hydroxylase-like FAD-dependent oxidoreductase